MPVADTDAAVVGDGVREDTAARLDSERVLVVEPVSGEDVRTAWPR